MGANERWDAKLLVGRHALEALEAERGAWERLTAADPKPTWFQHPAFVMPWYRHYSTAYEPVAVLARTDAGALVGVLALARDRSSGEVCHAGSHHATYHGWVAARAVEGLFPRRAVELVFEATGVDRWVWDPLPAGAPIYWVDRRRAPVAPLESRVVTVPIPYWDISGGAQIASKSRRKRLRNYANQYERRGEPLRLVRITDAAEAKPLVELAAMWVDVRISATQGARPFREDPNKLSFHEALATAPEPNCTHALMAGDRPICLQIDALEAGRMCLGLHAYDPSEGKFSPGTIMLLRLGEALAKDGGVEIDLTPGEDAWKFAFATDYRDGHSLEFFRTTGGATKTMASERAEREAVRRLRRFGQEPAAMRERVADLVARARRLRKRASVSGVRSAVFELDLSASAEAAGDDTLSPNALDGLAALDTDSPYAHEVVADALGRLGRGEQPIVVAGADGLELLAWLDVEPEDATLEDLAGGLSAWLLPSESKRACPDGSAFAVIAFEAEGAAPEAIDRLMRGLKARAGGKQRLWVLAPNAEASVEWLSERGRPAT